MTTLVALVAITAVDVRAQVEGWRPASVVYPSEMLAAASRIHGLAAGPEATLFAATDVGLLEFEGCDWDVVGDGYEALSVGVTAAGAVVVGTADGVGFHRAGAERQPLTMVTQGNGAFGAACQFDGSVYLASADELIQVVDDGEGGVEVASRWRANAITLPPPLRFVKPMVVGGELFALLDDPTNIERTVIAQRIDGALFQAVSDKTLWIRDAASAADGQLVLSTGRSGWLELRLDDQGRWREVGPFGPATSRSAASSIVAVPGEGYVRLSKAGPSELVALDGAHVCWLTPGTVKAAEVDGRGRIWLGGSGRVHRVHARSDLRVASVGGGAEVLGACELRRGTVLVASENGAVCFVPDPDRSMLPLVPGLAPGESWQDCVVSCGGGLLLSSTHGTILLDPDTMRWDRVATVPSDAAAIGDGTLALVHRRSVRILVAGPSGWEMAERIEMPRPVVQAAFSGRELWVRMRAGVGRFCLRGIDLDTGRHRDIDLDAREIAGCKRACFAIDDAGSVFAVGVDRGARPMFDGQRQNLRVTAAAPCDRGLWVISESDPEIAMLLDESGDVLLSRYCPREVTGRVVRDLLPLANGDLVVVAAEGRLVRSSLAPPEHAPSPRLRGVERAAGDGVHTSWIPIDPSRRVLDIDWAESAIRIRLRCPGVEFPDSATMEARLVGEGPRGPWLPVVDERLELVNLREGVYTLEARLRLPGGVVRHAELLELRVPPPWYRRWWAYAGLALLVAIAGGLVVRGRIDRERRRVALLEAEIRHRRSVEVALEEAHERLREAQGMAVQQERLQALGELAAGVAHDINNSLTPVLGYSELLSTDAPLAERDRRECADLLWRSARDIASVVDRLSHLYRPSLDRPEEIELERIFEEVKALSRPKWCDEALRRGVTIEVRVEPSSLRLVCTPSRLRDALMNLVLNAVDAIAAPGGVIRIRAEAVGRRVAIEVADDGAGMDAETQARCLQPFYSTKGVDGTGLGLANCQAIVAQHGGELEVESAPGEGTSVRMILPMRQLAAEREAPRAVPAELRACSILLVDDDDRVRRSIAAQLTFLGHAVTPLASGEAALEALGRDDAAFDMLVTDQGMPGMTGSQLIDRIRREGIAIATILISGWGEDVIEGSADAYLAKPATLDGFRGAIRRVVGGSRRADDGDAGAGGRGSRTGS